MQKIYAGTCYSFHEYFALYYIPSQVPVVFVCKYGVQPHACAEQDVVYVVGGSKALQCSRVS